MVKIENQCVGCDVCYRCGRDEAEVYYCDNCDEEIVGDVYEADGETLCLECLLATFIKEVFTCDKCKEEIDGDVYEVDGELLCESCLKDKFREDF